MALSTNGTVAERLSSDAASHLRTFVGQDVYDLSLSFAQWKRARSELLNREKKSSAPKAYVTFQTARAAVAAIARSARLPPQQEQLFLLLAREFEEERSARWADDPVAAEERRVQPSSMVFETDEYSHWAWQRV